MVYERIASRYDVSVDGSYTREITARLRVQSDAGLKQAGLLIFQYQRDLETVALVVRAHEPDGKVIETPAEGALEMPAEITRQAPLYSDLYEKHVTVKGLAIGDTLEYTFRSRVRPLIPGQFWLNYSFGSDAIILNEELQVSVPAGMQFTVKSVTNQSAVTAKDGARVYRWRSSNLKQRSEKERNAKARADERKVADVQISSFRSWEEIGKWYEGVQADRVAVTPGIQAKAAELTGRLKQPAEKAQALYRYVATNFRYTAILFGVGRYQPHPAEDVLGNGYGDCKDKHTLLAALLKAAGIPAQAALTTYNRAFDTEVPSPAQFSHVITRVPLDGDVVWLDTTLEVAPFGFLLAPLRDQYALVIAQDKPALLKTPARANRRNLESFTVHGKLDEKGTLTAAIELEASGDSEVALRSAFRQVPEAQWQELAQQISYRAGYAGTVSEVKLKTPPEDTSSDFAYSYHYKREEFGDWANRRILTACGPLGLADGGEKGDEPEPLWMGSEMEVECESSIELPPGYNATLPQSRDMYKPFAEFHVRYDVENRVLKTNRTLTLKVREIPREQIEAYREFRKSVLEAEEFITLSKADGGTRIRENKDPAVFFSSGAGSSPEANKAYDAGMELIKQQQISAAQEKFQEAAKIDPKHPRAWAALGMTYIIGGNVERGLELLRRQLQESPSLEIYKTLGMTLMQFRRQDEAVEVWKQALTLYPGDGDLPANLGTALRSQGRNQEAVAMLETAVSKNPEISSLRWQLAQAYRALGKNEEAVNMLHKAKELDDNASMWNNVAYELADMNRDLDEALRLAFQAVADQQEKASRISLEELSNDDLGTMQALAMYWDTIGWVHFRRGALDKAERYIRAAWELLQSGVIADHLAQICQAQKKKELAENYYAMAIAAPGAGSFKEAEKHLEALLPSASVRAGRVTRAREELSKARTFGVPRPSSVNGSGEFFVLLNAEGAVEDAKFIDGNTSVKPMTSELKKLHFGFTIPPNSDAKLVRRGIMMCTPPAANCNFVLLTVDSVRTVF